MKIHLLERSPGHWRIKIRQAGQKDAYETLRGSKADVELRRLQILGVHKRTDTDRAIETLRGAIDQIRQRLPNCKITITIEAGNQP